MSTVKKNTALTLSAAPLDWLRVASMVCCVLGILVAGYMAWAELTNNETVCADTGTIDCQAVQESVYAETFGIPVALLGLLGYIGMFGILLLEDQIAVFVQFGRTLVVGMALFGFLFQSYLTYIEADVLGKWCQWCVTSFVLITLVLGMGIYRLLHFLKPLRR